MLIKISLIILIICPLSVNCVIAQPIKTLTVQQLKDDYQVLIRTLNEAYPSLDRYNTKEEFEVFLQKKNATIKKGMTQKQFFTLVAQTVTMIKDEHLIATPSADYTANNNATNRYLPFNLKFIDGKMFVDKSSDPNLSRGAEIISINGKSSTVILKKLIPYVQHDGYIQTAIYRHLEDYSPTQNQNLFDLYFPFEFSLPEKCKITIREKDGKLRKTVVNSLTDDQYPEFYRKRNPMDSALQYRMIKPDIAYLNINSFHESYRNMFKQDFQKLFGEIFSNLDSVKKSNLILDLRHCEGGDNSSLWLLAYLMNKPFKVYDYLEVNYSGYPKVSTYFENPETSLLIDSFLQKMSSGKYRLKEEKASSVPGVMPVKPEAHAFRGRLFVLTSGATGSAAAIVASILKGNKRATFIGEETGGAMEGPTSLNISTLILPHTKIRIEIPHIKSQLAVPFIKGRGVIPDYSVQTSKNDLISGVDTQLKFAIKVIEKNGDDQ